MKTFFVGTLALMWVCGSSSVPDAGLYRVPPADFLGLRQGQTILRGTVPFGGPDAQICISVAADALEDFDARLYLGPAGSVDLKAEGRKHFRTCFRQLAPAGTELHLVSNADMRGRIVVDVELVQGLRN